MKDLATHHAAKTTLLEVGPHEGTASYSRGIGSVLLSPERHPARLLSLWGGDS